ncbi:MAG: hypothetical protein K8L97_17810 [Anaerolineae bacterium]|nr:hypothetical protein [Anaerolineae bacterium]
MLRPLNPKTCEICTTSCFAFAAFAEFFASYQPIRVAQTHPDNDDDDDNPHLRANPFSQSPQSPQTQPYALN